jgi:hypothetical protein
VSPDRTSPHVAVDPVAPTTRDQAEPARGLAPADPPAHLRPPTTDRSVRTGSHRAGCRTADSAARSSGRGPDRTGTPSACRPGAARAWSAGSRSWGITSALCGPSACPPFHARARHLSGVGQPYLT